jgi:hypothetical protein
MLSQSGGQHPVSGRFARYEITAVQWDGGPNYSIHGNSTRRLPDLELNDLRAIPDWGPPVLTFEILADGYRKVVSLPADFKVAGESRFPQEEVKPEWI